MKGNKLGRFIPLLLALFIILYASYQTYRFFFASYQTEGAYNFEVARVYTTTGLLIRSEQVLEQSKTDATRYVIDEGGKFIGTTPLAIQYSSSSAADAAITALQLQQEREALLDAQQIAQQSIKPDIVALNNSVYTTLRELILTTSINQVQDVSALRLGLIQDISTMQAAVGSASAFSQRVGELDQQIRQAETGSTVTSPQNGYFSRYVDHFEAQYTPAMLETLTIDQLDTLIHQPYRYDDAAFGKVITSYDWYYATTIPLSEAELFQVGTNMNLTFVGSDEPPVSGWVASITEDKNSNRAMLVVGSKDISADTVSRRTATVQLGFDDYRGIRFSKKALRIKDGVKGVYVLGKSSIQFKKVDILYTGNDFYLSRLDYNSDTYLNIFDEIIVEGSNIYDGRPLE